MLIPVILQTIEHIGNTGIFPNMQKGKIGLFFLDHPNIYSVMLSLYIIRDIEYDSPSGSQS